MELTAREIDLERDAMNEDMATVVLKILMYDHEKGWAKISSGLTQDFEYVKHSFSVRFDDQTEQCITFSVEET